MDILWTAQSSNTKTGNVPTAWVGRSRADTRASCSGCPLLGSADLPGGCYAHSGQPATALASVRRAERIDPNRYTLASAIGKRHQAARMVRVSAIGDVGRCGRAAADSIVATVRAAGLSLVGYTHHWRETDVAASWCGRLMASCDTGADVDRALSEGWRATLVVPETHRRVSATPNGARVVVCPAQERPEAGVTCNTCRLCDAARPGPVIAFRAHGSTKARV